MLSADLLQRYGYLVLFVGTFLEGETVLVMAGFLAHRGYLELNWVIAAAFLGTYAGDQLFFYLGRFKGRQILERRPGWQAKSGRVLRLLEHHQVPTILGFRFLYGLRSVTPFVLGMSNVGRVRFLILNGIGGLVWAVAIAVAGYHLGNAAHAVLGHIKRYETTIVAVIAVVGLVVWLGYFAWQRIRFRTR